jgi:hypothetical protein
MEVNGTMKTTEGSTKPAAHDPWYKYGVAMLFFEMAIAVAVSAYSLYLTFHGLGGFLGKH